MLLHTTTSCRLFGRLTVEMPGHGRWEKSIFCKGPPTLWLRVKDTFRFATLLGTGEIFILWTSPLAFFISSLKKNKEEILCLFYKTINLGRATVLSTMNFESPEYIWKESILPCKNKIFFRRFCKTDQKNRLEWMILKGGKGHMVDNRFYF